MTAFAFDVLRARAEPIGGSSPSYPLNATGLTLTFDRTWSPYVQGTLVCKLQSADDSAATDPRRGLGVKFDLVENIISAGSSAGYSIGAWLRSRTNDYVGGTTTITFESIESLLQDYVEFAGNTYTSSSTVLDTDILNDLLAHLRWDTSSAYPITGVSTVDGSASYSIAAADAGWSPGQTLWDVAQSVEEAGALWLHGDETGTQLLRSAATWTADTTPKLINDVDRIVSVIDAVDRDNPDWANTVAIQYPNATDYGVADAGVPRKTYLVNRSTKRPAAGAAQALANRMKSRGRNLTVTAIAVLSCRPNQKYRVQYLGFDWTGTVQAVTFRFPEGLMDITLNIVES